MNEIEVLKNMISYREKGIDEFIELHKIGGESILEIEVRTLKKALLALEFFNWVKKQKKKCEKDLMLYGDYYNKLLVAERMFQLYKEKLVIKKKVLKNKFRYG